MRDSYFDGTIWGYIGKNLLAIIIIVFSLGIAAPWAFCMMQKWKISHTIVNGQRLKFTGSGLEAIGLWILCVELPYAIFCGIIVGFCLQLFANPSSGTLSIILLVLIAASFYTIFIRLQILKWIAKHTFYDKQIVPNQAKDINESDQSAEKNYTVSAPEYEVKKHCSIISLNFGRNNYNNWIIFGNVFALVWMDYNWSRVYIFNLWLLSSDLILLS